MKEPVCLSGKKLHLLPKPGAFPSESRGSRCSVPFQTRRSDCCGGKLSFFTDKTTELYQPGHWCCVFVLQGQDLTRAMSRQEVKAQLGDQECEVKTLDNTHLYCEPPEIQPMSVDDGNKLPSLKVKHGVRVRVPHPWPHALISIIVFSAEGSGHTDTNAAVAQLGQQRYRYV